jgi:AcrR family transcriptional regulator
VRGPRAVRQRKPPRRTRERIVETSRTLFNVAGERHTTSADIAAEMGISPGNLYYHFRNKTAIVATLFSEYDARVRLVLDVPSERVPNLEDLWFLLHHVFEAMWEYRFLYRDLDEVTTNDAKLGRAFGKLVRDVAATFMTLCETMRQVGRMHASAREIAMLGDNVALVATFWMPFRKLMSTSGDDPVEDIALAASQVLALVAPYLDGDGRALLDRIADDYR